MELLVVDNDEVVNLAESGFGSEEAFRDAFCDEFEYVQTRSLGFEDWSNALREDDAATAELRFSKALNKYLVSKCSEVNNGYCVTEESWLCDTKEEAMERFNAYEVGYLTQKEEIHKFRDAIGIDGIWLDARRIGFGQPWCMNVKYNWLLLIERILSPDAKLVKEQVERCEALHTKLREVGLRLTEMYKHRYWNGNERYYVFKFEGADGEEYEYERCISRKYQHKGDRLVLDFLDEKWLADLIEQERTNGTKQKVEEYQEKVRQKNKELWADVDRYDEATPSTLAPVSYEKILPLFEYLESKVFPDGDHSHFSCDGTIGKTRAWLEEHMAEQVVPIMSHIRKNGGYCDCEVLSNAADKKCWSITEKKQPKNL